MKNPVGVALVGLVLGIGLVAGVVAFVASGPPPATATTAAPAAAPAPAAVGWPDVAPLPEPPAAPPQAPSRRQEAAPVSIAWVNLSALFQEGVGNTLVDQKLNELKALADGETQQLTELENRLKDLEDRAAPLPTDSALRRDLERQFEETAIDYELKSTVAERRLAAERARMQVQIYDRISQAIRTVAERDGLHIVLRLDDLGLDRERGTETMLQRIQIRSLLYAHPSLDITERVKAEVNRR